MAAVFPFGAAGSTFLMGLAYDKIKGAPRALLFGCSQAVAVGCVRVLLRHLFALGCLLVFLS
eukprot:COSAG05_NODE_12_length_37297_cov_117.537072_31_plen_62_part_00